MLLSGSALSRQYWNRSYFDVWKVDNTLEITFLVFDYDFGPAGENGYIQRFIIEYSRDGRNFYYLMSASTGDQKYVGNWTWLYMRDKISSAKIFFRNCFNPAPGTMWPEDNQNQRVELNNWANGSRAWFTVIWNLGIRYKDVKSLRISGLWWVNGIYMNDRINFEVYPINKFIISESKTPATIDLVEKNIKMPSSDLPENSAVKVSKQAGQIVVKGADTGQTINVYTTTGAMIKSIVITNNDDIKIKLQAGLIYILNIGQARYKVVL